MPHQLNGIHRRRQRGLSLIELMVGITIGMIVVAGAIVMMVNQVAEHRRLILETQVQQDLRAAADLMLRDLRRSGFWAAPENGVALVSNGSAPADGARNPYTGINVPSPQEITYSYSTTTPENNLSDPAEKFGFRLRSGMLDFNLGGNWQPLTDANTLTITNLIITPVVQEVPLADYCARACAATATNCPPVLQVRRIDIALTGQATNDSRVVRSIAVSSRIRNDGVVGSCS